MVEYVLTRHRATVCIGLSSKNVSLSRPPGWEAESYGYHGDDGDIYNQHNNGKRYGPHFGPEDTVGCGVNFRTKTAFFTRNGIFLSMDSSPACGPRTSDLSADKPRRNCLSGHKGEAISYYWREEAWRAYPSEFRSTTFYFRHQQNDESKSFPRFRASSRPLTSIYCIGRASQYSRCYFASEVGCYLSDSTRCI